MNMSRIEFSYLKNRKNILKCEIDIKIFLFEIKGFDNFLSHKIEIATLPSLWYHLHITRSPNTVPENECELFAVLWSKTAIFRGQGQNVDMQPHPWAPTALIPHTRAFKRGILLCCISRGSKVTSRQNLNVYILHHFP